MKNKALTFSLLALIGLLFVAVLLYKNLSPDYVPEQLATAATTISTEPVESTLDSTATLPTEESHTETTQLPLAPDFTVYDREGTAYRLSDFRGKPVVLNFWASWCGPCKQEMPDFNDAYLALGEEIHFLMVNLTDGSQETVDSASDFLASTDYTFPVYFDTSVEAAIAYSVYSIPTTYFIDAEGYAIAQASGAISADTLQQGIDMIYAPVD